MPTSPTAKKDSGWIVCHACPNTRRTNSEFCPHCRAPKLATPPETKKCVACAEEILLDAKLCKHCRTEQPEIAPPPPVPVVNRKSTLSRRSVGALVIAILAIVALAYYGVQHPLTPAEVAANKQREVAYKQQQEAAQKAAAATRAVEDKAKVLEALCLADWTKCTDPVRAAESKAKAHKNECRSDWAKCANNAEIVNDYSKWTHVQADCKTAANGQARYGKPDWGSWSRPTFGTYVVGNSYVTSGIAVAVDPDVQFQNGFGAMVHSRVTCTYDLRSERVIGVDISPR